MRLRRRKPDPLPVRPKPTVFELMEHHSCPTDPLPQEFYATSVRFFSECPACHHPLAVHTFSQPCPLCVWELRWGALALEHWTLRKDEP